ncbi:hypothetical protein [Levilactobacillus brevis]|uniref:hypothetical protein n=1 Tax=Levilactobacillus brevis TaxID=1580 RepID=UPI002073FE05|nr:hypothetical protein [Levilactobacillus brevis]MCM6796951.1 hypothetical protein [Levilactobacillus brevis]
MIKAEWWYLKQHKLLMIVLFVIMLIPSIYAVTFLKSMWDPYGKLSDLPVAVVNHDHAVDYQGQHLAAGQTLAPICDTLMGWISKLLVPKVPLGASRRENTI